MSTTADQVNLAPSPYPPVEQILLARGTRGMDRLALHLPPDYCARAARAAWATRARVLITTGFYVSGQPETDGPPGAFFLARGLAQTGARVLFVSEAETLVLLRALAGAMWPAGQPPPEYDAFPILDAAGSQAFAARLLASWRPTLVIAVERCGRCADGRYRNRRGDDITLYTARIDGLM